MTFEFMYDNNWYKYENGRIKKKCCFDFYDYFCPVLTDLNDKLNDLSADQCKSIMEAILHSYFYGIGEGKKEKILEFKRVFQLD